MDDSASVVRGTGLYLYCLAHSSRLPDIAGAGLDGQTPLRLERFQDVAAVVSHVGLEDFCGPAAEARMQDLSWVGPRACRHEEVVEQVMAQSPVLPARFGTIFFSPESLRERLRAYYLVIGEFLERVTDKHEWAVKALLDRAKAKEEILPALLARESRRLASLTPGIRYFQEQRILSGVEKELKGWLREVCGRVAGELNQHAAGFCERKVILRRPAAEGRETLLNWAFLVPRQRVTEFQAGVERANTEHIPRGLVFESSGPWPPYSFSPALEEKT